MNIIKQSRELTPIEEFMLTLNPEIVSLKDVSDGTDIHVDLWAIFKDANSKGEETEILSIMDSTGDKPIVYSCQSQTFKEMFVSIKDIYEKAGQETFTITKISGVSKGGRDYINCTIKM